MPNTPGSRNRDSINTIPLTSLGNESSDEPPPLCTDILQKTVLSNKNQSCSLKQWNDWKWQIDHRIKTIEELKQIFPNIDISGLHEVIDKFPMAITPYYASLISKFDSIDPVFRQSIPQIEEMISPPCLNDDPLEEEKDMPVPGLIHRYSDRALIIATTMCSMYCRHCTRKRIAGQKESSITDNYLRRIVDYLKKHQEIHDVIISGGDPFTLSTIFLEQIIKSIRSIETIDIIRIGTRTPVVLPMRINNELVSMLKKYHPIFINTHFNHPSEITKEASTACSTLVDAGIPVGNQCVLLKGINDDPYIQEQLCRKLIRNRVRPYYLFQCDLVKGVEHFRTPLTKGMEIIEYLRGRLSGLAIPTFVVDAPHGGGKIPIMPNYIISQSPTHTVLRNYEGLLIAYPEPKISSGIQNVVPKLESAPGVWELLSGNYSKIRPEYSSRLLRRKERNIT